MPCPLCFNSLQMQSSWSPGLAQSTKQSIDPSWKMGESVPTHDVGFLLRFFKPWMPVYFSRQFTISFLTPWSERLFLTKWARIMPPTLMPAKVQRMKIALPVWTHSAALMLCSPDSLFSRCWGACLQCGWGKVMEYSLGFDVWSFFFLTEHLLVEWYLDYVAIFLARDKDGPAKGRKVITIIGNEL